MWSPRTECILHFLLAFVVVGIAKTLEPTRRDPRTYSSTSQCHMCYQNAQIYFVTSHLNSEALEVTLSFIKKKKKKMRHLQFKKVVLVNNLGLCLKYNVEISDTLSLSYLLYPNVIFTTQK